jgi:hypothetical protein
MGGTLPPSGVFRVVCPLIIYTDVDDFICKVTEESQLPCLQGLARPRRSVISGHTPHCAHDLQRIEYQLDSVYLMVWVAWRVIDGGDPSLPGVIATGVDHEHVLGPLNPKPILIDQDLDRVSPELLVDVDAKGVAANLPLSAPRAGDVAEAEDARQTARVHRPAPGIAESHRWRQRGDPAPGVLAFVSPMAPELIVLHELRVLLVDQRPLRTAKDVGIQHPALDRETTFGQVLPGMALRDRGPLDRELFKTRLQRHKHHPMIADEALWGAPLSDGLAEDLAQPREGLPLEAAGPDNSPTVAIEDQYAIKPLAVDLDEIPQVGKPDLVGSRGLSGAFVGIGDTFRPPCGRMRLFVEGDHLPDRGVAVPIPQGIQRHLHAVMAQEGVVVQLLADLHHHLD